MNVEETRAANHTHATIEDLRRDLAAARAENEALRTYPPAAEYADLPADLAAARAENERLRLAPPYLVGLRNVDIDDAADPARAGGQMNTEEAQAIVRSWSGWDAAPLATRDAARFLADEVERLRGIETRLRDHLGDAGERIVAARAEIDRLNTNATIAGEMLNSRAVELAAADAEIRELTELQAAKNQRQLAAYHEMQTERDAARAEVERLKIGFLARIGDLDKALTVEEAKLAAAVSENAWWKQEVEDAHASKLRAHAELAVAHAELTNVQRSLQETHDQRNELQAELNAARAEIEDLNEWVETSMTRVQRDEALEQLAAAHAEIERLRSLLDRDNPYLGHQQCIPREWIEEQQ